MAMARYLAGPLGGALRGRQAAQQQQMQQQQQGMNLLQAMEAMNQGRQSMALNQARFGMQQQEYKDRQEAAKQKAIQDSLERNRRLYGPWTPEEKLQKKRAEEIQWKMDKGTRPEPSKAPSIVLTHQFMNSTDDSWAAYAANGYTDPSVLELRPNPRISTKTMENIAGFAIDNPDSGEIISQIYGDQYAPLGTAIAHSPAAERKQLETEEAKEEILTEQVERKGKTLDNIITEIEGRMAGVEEEFYRDQLLLEIKKAKKDIEKVETDIDKGKAMAEYYANKVISDDPTALNPAQARLFFKDLVDLYGGEQEKAKALATMASNLFGKLMNTKEYRRDPKGAWAKAKEITDAAAAEYGWSPEELQWLADEIQGYMAQYGYGVVKPEQEPSPADEAAASAWEVISTGE